MNQVPRVAFFTDSFGEVNGVARTSRSLAAFAARRGFPMLCLYGGPVSHERTDGSLALRSFERSRVGFGLESDLRFDLLFWRYRGVIADRLRQFAPDVVHVTGPGDAGQLGAYLAHVMDIPLIASWHTNLHDFAALRLGRLLRAVPRTGRRAVVEAARRQVLRLVLDFYRIPRRVLAPNPELVDLVRDVTGRPVDLMPRGVDTERFSPRWAAPRPAVFQIGYVGRLSPEKNVRMLVELERGLVERGRRGFKFVIVGDGSERRWLSDHLRHADFRGVKEGEVLSKAYANMDVLVFPSETDTFGNVVLEALASGTPVVAANAGGPRFIVRHGVSGYLASTPREYVDAVDSLMSDGTARLDMRSAARQQAMSASWDSVFEGVYDAYRRCIAARQETKAPKTPTLGGRLVLRGIRTLQGPAGGQPSLASR